MNSEWIPTEQELNIIPFLLKNDPKTVANYIANSTKMTKEEIVDLFVKIRTELGIKVVEVKNELLKMINDYMIDQPLKALDDLKGGIYRERQYKVTSLRDGKVWVHEVPFDKSEVDVLFEKIYASTARK